MRPYLELPRELWIEIFGKSWSRAIERKGPCLYVCTDGSRRACGVGACARLVATLGAPRETSGPRIDRFPSTRPPWCCRQYRDVQKLIFLAPSFCRIAIFGPLADRTILKRLHGASHFKTKASKRVSPRHAGAAFLARCCLKAAKKYCIYRPETPATPGRSKFEQC